MQLPVSGSLISALLCSLVPWYGPPWSSGATWVVAAEGSATYLPAGKPSLHSLYPWLLLIPQIREFKQTSPSDKSFGSLPCCGPRAVGWSYKDHLFCTERSKELVTLHSFLLRERQRGVASLGSEGESLIRGGGREKSHPVPWSFLVLQNNN